MLTLGHTGQFNRSLSLPEENVSDFENFLDYLYRGNFHHSMFGISEYDGEQGHIIQSVRLFLLAEKYSVDALKLDICKDLFYVMSKLEEGTAVKPPSFAVLDYTYALTKRKSPLRMLMADWFASWEPTDWQPEGQSTDWLYNIPDFGADLALSLQFQFDMKRKAAFDMTAPEYLQRLKGLGENS